MTLNEYQELAQRTSRKDISPDDHLFNALLGLAGETGECCDLVKKCFYQDGRDIRESMLEELGDVLWYVAEAAEAMGYELEDVARHNIDKLRQRYPDGFDAERSLHREQAALPDVEDVLRKVEAKAPYLAAFLRASNITVKKDGIWCEPYTSFGKDMLKMRCGEIEDITQAAFRLPFHMHIDD